MDLDGLGAHDDATNPTAGAPVHDVVAGLDGIVDGAALVVGAGTATLSDRELREAAAAAWRARSRVEAAYLHVLRALDERDGAVTGAAPGRGGRTFLVQALTATPGAAAADVAAAHAVDPRVGSLPQLGAALAAGDVSRAHADVAVRTLRRIPSHLAAQVADDGISGAQRVDAFLTEHSRRHSPRDVDRLAAQVLATIAPERADRYDPDAVMRRHASWVTDSTGMLIGRFQLDPASGATVKAALDLFVRRGAVQADAGATNGPGTHGLDSHGPDPQALDRIGPSQAALPVADERSGGQRAADALTDLAATALRAAGREGGAPAAQPTAQVMIVATPEQIAAARRAVIGPVDAATGEPQQPPPSSPPPGRVGQNPGGQNLEHHRADGQYTEGQYAEGQYAEGQYADGQNPGGSGGAIGLAVCSQAGPLSAGAFGRLACDAALHLVTLDGKGAALSLGRSTRLASVAQRRALAARDRGCIAPGCAAPAGMCEAHHVRWWRHGGATDVANLALLCARHHTGVHSGHWRLTMIEGVPWVIPPRWADPHGRPRRNTLHDDEDAARRLGQQLRLNLMSDPDPPGTPDHTTRFGAA